MLFYNIKDNIIQTSVNGSLVNFNVDETNQGSIEHVELMKDDYIELHFNSKSPVYFPIGTYCTYNGKKYYVLDKQKPSVTTTGLEYKLKLESYYMKWKNILCMYNKANGGEASWTLAGDITMFGNVIVHILADEGIKYNGSDIIFSVDSTVTADINTIEFSSVSIIEALNLIAEKFECEWWITDNVIHFGKCELGTDYVKLEVGDEIASNSPSNSDSKFSNRIYAFGSDKNIPVTYRKHLIFTCDTIGSRNGKTTIFDSTRPIKTTYFAGAPNSSVIVQTSIKFLTGAYAGNTYNVTINPDAVLNGGLIMLDASITPSTTDTYSIPNILPSQVPVSYYTADNDYVKNSVVQNRLALPSSKPYVGIEDIDDITNLDIDENDDIVPSIVLFEKEYPKLTSTVQSVSVEMINYKDSDGNILDEKYPQYTVVLNQPTNFDKKYVIGTLRCAFQSGLLAGSEYELQFNSGTSFTIVNNSDYGRQLPDLNLLPKVGDTLIMYNYDTQYFLSTSISDAELHLKQTAIDYLKKSLIDPTTYTSKRSVNNDNQLALGTKVNLIDPEHIQSKTIAGVVYGRKSRIYGYEKALDGSSLTYTVGESTIYSRLNSLESKVDSIEYNGASYQYSGSGNGASVYLITSNDTTVASDSNTFSAQRSKKEFLSKTQADRTDYDMTFGKNITVDGQALLNDVVASTGTFGGLLKAASATITGALLASTVNATTVNANTFIGELQGNAATATQLKTTHKIFGNDFNGLSDVNGNLSEVSGIYFTSGNTIAKRGGNNLDIFGAMYFYQNGIVGLGLPNNGNVGVGTPAPWYRLDVNGNMRVTSDLYADATVGTSNFASHTTGWNVNAQGAADFRNIYADELRVQAFTADISQALAGSDYLTKSVSKLSANFVVPAVNSTVRIIVDDIEGMPATQCFANNDYIRFRAFNRTSGLTVANAWGKVVLDTTFGTNGFLNGTQAYIFTCTQTTGAGLTVFKGSEVLDYGISESGLIARTTLDTMGSPYEQIATWVNDPSNGNNYTVHARLGNLGGIANCNGYGVYTDNGFFTGKITVGDLTKTNHYLDFSNGALTVKGNIYLSNGRAAVSTLDMDNGISLAVDNIHVGARNLLTDTKTFANYGNYPYWIKEGTQYKGLDVFSRSASWTGLYKSITLESGKVYTFSAYVKGDSNCNIYMFGGTNLEGVSFGNITEWTRIHCTFTADSNTYKPRIENATNGSYIAVCGYTLIEGNKGYEDWSPAPEDVDESINLKVSKDGVIGAINLTSEAATINASKINLVGAVTANSIVAGAVTTEKLYAGAVTAAKIAANSITSDKVNMSEFTASNGFVDSFNANVIATKRLDVAKIVADGIAAQTIDAQSATISNLKVVNATVSGTLNSVSGTFNYLQAVGSNGRLIFANTYGSLAIEDDDFIQQGTKNNRTLRFLSSNIRCRGSFGASSMNTARVHDTYIDYYVNGDTDSYVRFNLQSNGVGGYYVPLYPSSVTGYDSVYGNAVLGDEKGFPVDLVIFDNSAPYQYELLRGNPNKKVTVVNAHDGSITVNLTINGKTDWVLHGGKVQTFINIREFTNPLISSSVHGAGWMLCGEFDNDWA